MGEFLDALICVKKYRPNSFPFFLTKGIEMKLVETMASAKEHLFLMVIAQPSQQLFLALNFRLEKKILNECFLPTNYNLHCSMYFLFA